MAKGVWGGAADEAVAGAPIIKQAFSLEEAPTFGRVLHCFYHKGVLSKKIN
jgi:hypothetical protein